MEPHNVFFKLLEWVWVPMAGTIVHLYAKVFTLASGVNKAVGILQTTNRHHDLQRIEDNDRTQREIAEVKTKIDAHHKIMMDEIRALRNDIKSL